MTTNTTTTSRDDVLALLNGQPISRVPCFGGLIAVTEPGLNSLNLKFAEVHNDPQKMARAAATTYRMFGFEAVSVPLDICVEAEALGAEVDFREEEKWPSFPIVKQAVAASLEHLQLPAASNMRERGRIPLVMDAIRRLKEDVGQEVVVGGWVPGPFTLAMYVIEPNSLVTTVARDPQSLSAMIDGLTDILTEVASAYLDAGADYITVHEMGGSPGYLGPPVFTSLLLPRLQRLVEALPAPSVLSVCGRTTKAIGLLAEVGANAISVDQLNDIAQSRETLGPEPLLFGNIDPVSILANGSEDDVRQAVNEAISAGVDAVWPGCDLWPLVPAANMQAMVDAARQA